MSDDSVKAKAERLLVLEAKATPGPWIEFTDDGKPCAILPAMRSGEICSTAKSKRVDSRFIVAFRNDAPDLARAVLAYEQDREAMAEVEAQARIWCLPGEYNPSQEAMREALAKLDEVRK